MKIVWFRKFGWIFLPIHPMGFFVSMLAVLFLIPVFIAVITNGHSVSDDGYHIFVYTTCTAFWWKWVAEMTAKEEPHN